MSATQNAPVDIVVPVYNAADDLARCIESVLAHTSGEYRLVLIDDASPSSAVGAFFRDLGGRALPQVTLLANEHNLGFTRTANRGMTRSRADIVLLNSDTMVTAGWLKAILRCAASDSRIGTITPFSNNAEICSFPRFCENNPWFDGADPEPVRAALARASVPSYPDLPTGVGFCMFIRRAVLDAVGVFDEVFGAGYGEENDLCLRAERAGFRNVLADDAFVVHAGGRSFAGRKETLGARNLALLLERHPDYNERVHTYIAADPLAPLREAAWSELALATGPSRGVLHVIHHHGGGTETHVRELIAASRDRWRHCLAIAVGDHWQLEDHRSDGTVSSFAFQRDENESWPDFLRGLAATFAIDLIHLHNISGCREGLLEAIASAGIPHGFTVHDLNLACPTNSLLDETVRYCGGKTDSAVCNACLAAQPAFAGIDIIRWRETHRRLLEEARFLIAPSQWSAGMLTRYFPGCKATVIPHGTPVYPVPRSAGARMALVLPDDDLPTVAVLGAIGPDKGARRLERLVTLARERDAPVRFVAIGYLDVQQKPWQSDDARFIVHGRYDPRDLPDLLAHYRVALVLYPSEGPESFSYTLSETWCAGLPALVPPIGALAERVEATNAGWVMTESEWRDETRMLERVLALLDPYGAPELAAARRWASFVALPTLREMADPTVALYAAAAKPAWTQDARLSARFAPERVRDALGYRPWSPPVLAQEQASASPQGMPDAVASPSFGSRIARAALRMRHTPLGRVAFRLTPQPVLAALKARLR